MKTFYKSIAAAILGITALSSNAQVVFSENFNSSTSIQNWTLIDQDGNTPQANYAFFTDAWISFPDPDSSAIGDTCVASTSWYTPAGTADDYLISPSIILPANAVLQFDAQASDASFPDGYEVLISTTSADLAGLNANPVLLSIPAENAFWTNRTVNLGAYAGDTVHIAIRNNSNDKNILFIDNFTVNVLPSYDASILVATPLSEYSNLPLAQADTIVAGAVVQNSGSDTLTNVKMNFNLKRNGVTVFTDSSVVPSILPGAAPQPLFLLSNFVPSATGAYHLEYVLSHSNMDANMADNVFISDSLFITDSTLARDNGIATGSLGIGAGTAGELGTVFELNAADTLSSVSTFIVNGNGTMTNQPLSVNIRNFVNGLPGSIIATSDTLTYTATGSAQVELTFDNIGGSLILPADSFFVGVVEGDSNVTIGTSSANFYANTNFVIFGANPWRANEVLSPNFATNYMIRPNFGTPRMVSVGLDDQSSTAKFAVYPNPSNGLFTLDIESEENLGNVQVEVYDITGKSVYTNNFFAANNLMKQVNLSNLNGGIYFLRTVINGNNTIQKISIK